MPRTAPILPRTLRVVTWGLAALGAVLAGAGCGPGDDAGAEACSGILAGDLVITEVMADPDGDDEGQEWFEVYNASTSAIDLKGVVVTHSRPDDASSKSHTMESLTVPAGGYVVLADTSPTLVPVWADYGYNRDLGTLFNTGGGKFALSCGASEIDHATYEQVESGHSRTLDGGRAPDYQVNDDLTSWCESDEAAAHEYNPDNFGTPRAANQDCMNVIPGMCEEGGNPRPTVAPMPGDLTITEVIPSPGAVSDTTGEWFEVLVNRDLDLNDLGLDRASDTAMPVILTSATCLHVTAGTRLVFARSMDMVANGGLPRVDGVFSFSLIGGSAASPGDVRLLIGATELDSFTWTSSRNGKALQLKSGLTAPADNDVAANVCDATAMYGAGDLGTPGAANGACMGTSSGMCMDGAMMRPTVSPVAGDLTITEIHPRPAAVGAALGEWFEVLVNRDVDLNDLGLDRAGDAAAPTVLASVTCKRVTAGTYVVFAHNADMAMNGGLPRVDGVFGFALVDGSVASPGDVRVMMGMTELDSVSWTSSRSGKTLQLNAGLMAPADNDVAGNFCDGVTAYGPGGTGDLGTPGAVNAMCGGGGNGMCLDTGTNMMRAIVKPMAGQLTLNEWMPDSAMVVDTSGEWFEVKTTAAVDLNGIQAGAATLGTTPLIPASGNCVRVAAGGYALFARNAVTASNGGLPMVDATFGFGLTNNNGMLKVGIDNTVLSMGSWPSAVAGKAIMIDSDGTQCNAPAGVASYNGGMDFGTPRAVNTPPECP